MKEIFRRLLFGSPSDPKGTAESEKSHNFRAFGLSGQNPELVNNIGNIVGDHVMGDRDKLKEVLLLIKDVRVGVGEESEMDSLTLCEFSLACKEGVITYKIIADPHDHELTILPYGDNVMAGEGFLRESGKD